MLTPTRELAFQISEQFEALGSTIGVKCGMWPNFYFCSQLTFLSLCINVHLLFTVVIVGGIDMMSQSLVLAKKPHIVIGKTTPLEMHL